MALPRRAERVPEPPASGARGDAPPDAGPPPTDPFDEIELREDVRRLLLGLPPRQRAALVLTEIFGYPSDEAGAVLGIAATTVRVLASKGRAALRAD